MAIATTRSELGRYRSHRIGKLTPDLAGSRVRLSGRISHLRDHGGVLFVHLADGSGEVQLRMNPGSFEQLELGRELWLTVEGELALRPEGTENILNPLIVLPEHEMVVEKLEVLARPSLSLDRLPALDLPVSTGAAHGGAAETGEHSQTVSEEMLLEHRPFALRRPDLQRALRVRSRAAFAVRSFLESEGFCEIETPILAAPTPEGARDFLVPSRLHKGSGYALPQSPQIYKQLLMIGGFERYFQFSRCFRDEALRANRQLEFTQIDIEMALVSQDDVIDLVSRMTTSLLEAIKGHHGVALSPYRFTCMSQAEAMARYGSDAPDLRIPYQVEDLTEIFANTSFKIFRQFVDVGGAVLGVPVPAEGKLGRNEIDRLRAWAKTEDLPQPAWGDRKDGKFVSTIEKYFSEAERQALAACMEEGGQMFFAAAAPRRDAQAVAGKLRRELGLRSGLFDLDRLEFVWVTDFPAFERNEEGKIVPSHHPFTDLELPPEGELGDDRSEWLKLTSRAYDLVLNGEELGSGSIRIRDLEKQFRVLAMLGYKEERARTSFPHLVKGLQYGAPPHGGIALGFDRLIARLTGTESIRGVIAFPKDGRGRCLMTGSPSPIDEESLREVSLRPVAREAEKGSKGEGDDG